MIAPTDTFFVVDNFNTVPIDILKYCKDYIVYDASVDESIPSQLEAAGVKFIKIKRTGHNITTYFRYFTENYDNLPDFMCLTKGHMIGRHCSREFFDRVYNNKYFTYLYEDKSVLLKPNVCSLSMENMYLEKNNSWYVSSREHPHRYFDNYNRLLKFIYVNPIIPEYCLFAPGGCYIVEKAQVLKHSRAFYNNLNKIMSYDLDPNFPSEAHQIERMLPIIFTANYAVNEWMNDESEFERRIEIEREKTLENDRLREKREHNYFFKILYKFNNYRKN